jgi:hypothetical protein
MSSTYEERMDIAWYKILVDGMFDNFSTHRIRVDVCGKDGGYKVQAEPLDNLMMSTPDRIFTLFGLDHLSLGALRATLATQTVKELEILGLDTAPLKGSIEQAALFIKYRTARQKGSLSNFLGVETVRQLGCRMLEDFGTWVARVPEAVVPSYRLSENSYGALRPAYATASVQEERRRTDFVNLVRLIGRYTVGSYTDIGVRYKSTGRNPRHFIFTLASGEQDLDAKELARLYRGKWKLEAYEGHNLSDLFDDIVGESYRVRNTFMLQVLKHGVAGVHAYIDAAVAVMEARAPGIDKLWGRGKPKDLQWELLDLVCSGPEAPMNVNGRYEEGSMAHRLSELVLKHGEGKAKEVAKMLYLKEEP